MVRLLKHEIHFVNKLLSVQYSIVNYKCNVVQQIYRNYLSCITETYACWLVTPYFLLLPGLEKHHSTLWFY